MDYKNIYSRPAVSFEIFPPKKKENEQSLFMELEKLCIFNPAFISVTYGAGGSTRDKTFEIALKVRNTLSINPLIHFTCVGAGRAEIKEHLEKAKSVGLTDILALRGDPPSGPGAFIPVKDGFSFADELVGYIKELGGFSIAVAGYPEKHPEADTYENDINSLKRKIDAGAELVITQFFFNNEDFYRFRDSLAHVGCCDIPIVPGMLPVTSMTQIEKFAYLTGASIPSALRLKLESCSNPEDLVEYGIEYCTKQCVDLKDQGVKGFHMYCLNKAYAVSKVLKNIGFPC